MNLSEIQIDRSALRHNVSALKTLVSAGVQAIAVVKANAYGHGLREVVSTLEGDVDGFQVDDVDELVELRRHTDKRVLILGYVPKAGLDDAVRLGAEVAIFDLERIYELARVAKNSGIRPKVHLKIDALLGRLGVLPEHLDEIVALLRGHPEIELVSAYAHFANIEDTTDLGHAYEQAELFNDCWQRLRSTGWPRLGRHMSATSGAMTSFKGMDLVRFGIGIYGMYPSPALARQNPDVELRPALRWVSHLAQVKTLPRHHPVGYGLTFLTPREMKIGIVPQGYSDGYDRGLSNCGEVLVRGVRCSVLGRVAMNMFAIDLTGVPDAANEDEVVLLGHQGGERITAEDIASRLGTINYEITARISPLLPRRLHSPERGL